LYAPFVVAGQNAALDSTALTLGESLTAAQRANVPSTYVFHAHAGEVYLIEVDQNGLDFLVTVEDPEGNVRSYQSPLRRDESELATLTASSNGDHRITIVSKELTNASGSPSIHVSALVPHDASDTRLRALRKMAMAASINADAERARIDAAVAKERFEELKKASLRAYREALGLWRKLAEPRMEARTLYSMAMLEYWDLYDWAGAAELAEQAARVYQDVDEVLYWRARFLHAYALVDVASELDRKVAAATFASALATFKKIASRYEQIDDLYGLAEVLNFVGYTHHLMGDFGDAELAWQRSASVFAQIGEWREELSVRQNLAVIDIDEGSLGDAINTFHYILDQIPEGQDLELEANVLENLGAANRDFGNIDEALQAYSRALALRHELGDETHVSASLRGLGSTYYMSGEYERAISYLQQALAAAQTVGDGRSQAAILTYIGNIEYLRGDYAAAQQLHQDAVQHTNSDHDRAVRQLLIAKDLVASGHPRQALSIAEDVIATNTDMPIVRADALVQVGRIRIDSGEHGTAADQLQQALSLFRSIHLQEGEADALNALALAAHGSGRDTDAVKYGEAALDRIENLRVRVSAPELRALYTAAQRGFYETQIDILMSGRRSNDDLLAALSVSERGRARMLLDLLAAASIDSDDALDETLVQRRTKLYEDLAARSYQRDRLLANPIDSAATQGRLDGLLDEMTTLENELTLLETQARQNRVLDSSLLTGQEIQESIAPDTVLLQYELGRNRSFVWVVTHDSIHAVELAPREAIEAATRDALVTLRTNISRATRRNQQLQLLADYVLTPISDLIVGERVLIAADGALHYVPFTVLPIIDNGASAPLIATRKVVSVPSISALVAQRSRRVSTPPNKTIAVFADPVFEVSDERLRRPDPGAPNPPSDASLLSRSPTFDLQRLRYSGREARDIAALVPESARLVLQGFEATRDGVLRADLTQYRYLHFATHGLVDSRYPALSALALSQFDEHGRSLAGLLRLNDIYNLRLNADLVVLSACDTALGREIRGEGLVGFTQGFLYAGAQALVLSLWRVSDAATAALMTRFYEHMIEEGATAANALRAAQLSMAEGGRWAAPYYWGAFVILGDAQ
jgi:CHAT domain-containing protein